MAVAGTRLFGAAGFSPAIRRCSDHRSPVALLRAAISTRRFAVPRAEQLSSSPAPAWSPAEDSAQTGKCLKDGELSGGAALSPFMEDEGSGPDLEDFFNLAKDLMGPDGGPPRWFSPLDCGSRLNNSPLLLYLPGIDGTGAGLALQHRKLGKIFDIWCLHIPVMDRTPFAELVKMIERTVKSENCKSPSRPIYLVGESLGACLALAVAARNPDVDLILILANPATSFSESPRQPLIPLLELMPDQFHLTRPLLRSLMRDDRLKIMRASSKKGLGPQETVMRLTTELLTMSSHIFVLANILPKETLVWKLQMLKSASVFASSRLHAVKAQILILLSGRDRLLSSLAEAPRLSRALEGCEIRKYEESGHFLFLEDGIDLVTIIKADGLYRRGKSVDYVSDYLPPTYSEFLKVYESNKLLNDMTSAVMLSTLEDGKIVRGFAGIPSQGPVLLVGYHMLLALELEPLVFRCLIETKIHVRGIAHPMIFAKYKDGDLGPDRSYFDKYRMMGAVPVSGMNLFKLLSRKSHVLLYPGGVREAMHRKGEEYKLFWPEQSEFVGMAARFGAKIVPFGVVGEDDICRVVFDYDDQMKIPYMRDLIRKKTDAYAKLRRSVSGEVANQDMHIPGIMPKIPGRFYFLFGKPIETEGRKQELKDKEKAQEVYLEVKSEVEKCLAYLKEKREGDPYRSIFSRLAYQTINGPSAEVPTFEL